MNNEAEPIKTGTDGTVSSCRAGSMENLETCQMHMPSKLGGLSGTSSGHMSVMV